jgi:uncharacterized protein with PQ loop repeat
MSAIEFTAVVITLVMSLAGYGDQFRKVLHAPDVSGFSLPFLGLAALTFASWVLVALYRNEAGIVDMPILIPNAAGLVTCSCVFAAVCAKRRNAKRSLLKETD